MARLETDPPWDQYMDPLFENIIANRSDNSSQLRFFIRVIAMCATQLKINQSLSYMKKESADPLWVTGV